MFDYTLLCVDDEENVLKALKRSLHSEGYRILTASSAPAGLALLEQNEVNLVISDQKMPEMNGVEFLALVRQRFPNTMRILLTGYTDIDSVIEAVNKGNVYRYFLKPWDDFALRMEIRQALNHYHVESLNRLLQKRIQEQNESLRIMNEKLERLVSLRSEDLKIQNRILELSYTILNDLPIAVVGVSTEELVVFVNAKVSDLSEGENIVLSRELQDCFSSDITEFVRGCLRGEKPYDRHPAEFMSEALHVQATPLSGRFSREGIILVLKPAPMDPDRRVS